MGETIAKIRLVNSVDQILAMRGVLKESEVRQRVVDAVVDTGAYTLVIPEALRGQLGLDVTGQDSVTLAGNVPHKSASAAPVTIHWEDRHSTISPIVLAGGDEVLLGFIPLEEMDLRVDPVHRRLEGVHGDTWVRFVR
ncbi:MAG: aspartyl protease family protein [Treponematales bacterium]